MSIGKERNISLISNDSNNENDSTSKKKSRGCSSDIDNHWKSVMNTAPIENRNHELPHVNNLLKELHFYRQARKTSRAMSRPLAKCKPTSIISSTVEEINGMDISCASIDSADMDVKTS